MTQLLKVQEIPGMVLSTALRLLGRTPTPPPMLSLADAHTLLDSDYHHVETGYGVAPDGLMCVAACVYMRDVTPEMIDWWFGWVRTTEQYKLWHPRDHVSSDWDGPKGLYIGGHHLVRESIGGETSTLRISFEDPAKYFGKGWREKFDATGYGTAICGRTAVWDERKGGYLATGHLLHLVKREPDGCRMRSRFWLGDVEGVPVHAGHFIPEKMAEGLMRHCLEEMSILASILPDLHRRETGARI